MQSRSDAQVLFGGTANFGRIVRVGDTVHRPAGPHTPAVHALLDHLHESGFGRAPQVLGGDADTEIVTYLPGTAARVPLPSWAATDDVISGVGALLRDYHEHAAGFAHAGRPWQRAVPEPWRGDLVTHNDLHPANVIFRDGRPVAMIDFDLAAPASAAFDLAVTVCFWAPLLAARDIDDGRRGHVVDRLRTLLEGYRADASLRHQVVTALPAANRWIAQVIEDNARRGHPAFGRMWPHARGMHRRASWWLSTHTDELLVASR